MSKHTPGPWKVNKAWGTVEGPREQEICAIFPADESGRREPRATAQANARLISAAPDMLDALKALFEHCAMIHKNWGENSNSRQADEAIAAALAAIAKATGE